MQTSKFRFPLIIAKTLKSATPKLKKILQASFSIKNFFDLFVDFKGYVDFFYLQDCVSNDYNRVNFWLGSANFEYYPLPKTVDEYLYWIEKELDFVDKRNQRINHAVKELSI